MDGTHADGTLNEPPLDGTLSRGYKSVFIQAVPRGDPTADFYSGGVPRGRPGALRQSRQPWHSSGARDRENWIRRGPIISSANYRVRSNQGFQSLTSAEIPPITLPHNSYYPR